MTAFSSRCACRRSISSSKASAVSGLVTASNHFSKPGASRVPLSGSSAHIASREMADQDDEEEEAPEEDEDDEEEEEEAGAAAGAF